MLPALTNDLLGATPTGPGFSTWTVAPHPGSVTWARGQLPTPHGPLRVAWSKGRKGLTLTVDAPPGTSGTITLPSNGKQIVLRGVTGHRTVTMIGE